ncbi:MAG: MFS transporter [Anaerolineae bacterium]|nr:MFS transporter [Anaerolineae bacterium]
MNTNLRTFYTLAFTQVFSLIGSLMSGVAVGIWIVEQTGESTPLLLTSFFANLPLLLGGIVAGVFVDRWNRRSVLILSDLGQAVGTAALLLDLLSGSFQIWHLYVIALWQGTFGMFQRPAMDASITLLVPENQRDRANVLRQLTGPLAGVIAPTIVGFIYPLIHVNGIILIDLLTFVVAVSVVIRLRIPQQAAAIVRKVGLRSVWDDMREGFQFIWSRRVLFWLMVYAAFLNFLLAGPMNLTTPYILALTGSERTLGILLGILNLGIIVGGIVVSIWGGTRPRIHGIMIGLLVRALFLMLYGIARVPLALGFALFFVFFTNPLVDASNMSLLQSKVPPEKQGRVFALLFQMMYAAQPFSYLLTGPLVDRILEPAVGTARWESVAWLVGDSPGSGMGLLMVAAGILLFILTALVYAHPKTRRVEADIPDYVAEGISR